VELSRRFSIGFLTAQELYEHFRGDGPHTRITSPQAVGDA
jgi:hypothetical protein